MDVVSGITSIWCISLYSICIYTAIYNNESFDNQSVLSVNSYKIYFNFCLWSKLDT